MPPGAPPFPPPPGMRPPFPPPPHLFPPGQGPPFPPAMPMPPPTFVPAANPNPTPNSEPVHFPNMPSMQPIRAPEPGPSLPATPATPVEGQLVLPNPALRQTIPDLKKKMSLKYDDANFSPVRFFPHSISILSRPLIILVSYHRTKNVGEAQGISSSPAHQPKNLGARNVRAPRIYSSPYSSIRRRCPYFLLFSIFLVP